MGDAGSGKQGLGQGSKPIVGEEQTVWERRGKATQSAGMDEGGAGTSTFTSGARSLRSPPLKCLMRRRRGQWRRRMMEEKLLAHARGEPGDMSHAVSGGSVRGFDGHEHGVATLRACGASHRVRPRWYLLILPLGE
jgi:hypothetical protein